MKHFAIAVQELIRDYHVTRTNADKGFGRAVIRSAFSIILQSIRKEPREW